MLGYTKESKSKMFKMRLHWSRNTSVVAVSPSNRRIAYLLDKSSTETETFLYVMPTMCGMMIA